jgi:hypothetical protein
MTKIITALFVSSISFAALAKDPTITCSLVDKKNAKNKATVSTSLKNEDYVSSNSIDIGKRDNYSYDLSLEKEGALTNVYVTFYENNHVQDEVGSMGCTYDPKTVSEVFCEEPIVGDNGKLIATFSCQVK